MIFGRKRRMRKDLPAIDIRKKPVKGLFGKTKLVPTTKKEQRRMKEKLMKQFPDRYYIDDLREWNSISGKDADLRWIDEIEEMETLFFD